MVLKLEGGLAALSLAIALTYLSRSSVLWYNVYHNVLSGLCI